jgi:hypothetical protein
MRLLAVIILSCSIAAGFASDEACFQNFVRGFPAFPKSSVEILFDAPTNDWPAALWIYKVVPQKFSDHAVSNLITIGSFSLADAVDNSKTGFCSSDKSRSLQIVAAQGWIQYWNNKAIIVKGDIEGVPSKTEAQGLALKLLNSLGLSHSELARKPGETNFLTFEDVRERTRFDKVRKESVTETSGRGIYFVRQIDGIPIAGIGAGGGFHVKFGNKGAIAELDLSWRNLKQDQHREVVSPKELCEFIKAGHAVLTHRDIAGPDGTDSLKARTAAKKLTITKVDFLYTSQRASDPQDFTCPFAKVEARTEIDGTNAPVQLYCPVLSDRLVK